MKTITLGLALLLTSTGAYAFEQSAVESALSSEFARVDTVSSIEYSEADGKTCDLMAHVYTRAQRSSSTQMRNYTCDICLVSDDNLLWDYTEVECEFDWE